jgi:hypothetical protein
MMQADADARRRNQQRLRDLARDHGSDVALFCSHDATDFLRFAGRSPYGTVRDDEQRRFATR